MGAEGRAALGPAAKRLLGLTGLVLASVLAGFALLVAAFSLPTAPMLENARRSEAVFEKEGNYPYLLRGVDQTELDNYTDRIMLSEATALVEKGPVQAALTNWYGVKPDANGSPAPVLGLASATEAGTDAVPYFRYWHGYLVWLRPLLLFLPYTGIRLVLLAVETALTLLLLWRLFRALGLWVAGAFAVALAGLYPFVIWLSMQNSAVYLVTLLSCLALVHTKKAGREALPVFVLAGVAAAYFDLLTYPILVPALLLALEVLFSHRERPFWQSLRRLAGLGLAWLFGYAGMWCGKFLLTTLFTTHNAFLDAVGEASLWSGEAYTDYYVQFTRLDALWANLNIYWLRPRWWLSPTLFLALVFLALAIRRIGKERLVFCVHLGLLLALVALLPAVWYLFIYNHAYTHRFLEWRTAAGLAFPLLAIPAAAFAQKKGESI